MCVCVGGVGGGGEGGRKGKERERGREKRDFQIQMSKFCYFFLYFLLLKEVIA